jgi:hypothetical protein
VGIWPNDSRFVPDPHPKIVQSINPPRSTPGTTDVPRCRRAPAHTPLSGGDSITARSLGMVRRRTKHASRIPAACELPECELVCSASGRGGRAVEGGALEKRRVARLRGFESHPLRHRPVAVDQGAGETGGASGLRTMNRDPRSGQRPPVVPPGLCGGCRYSRRVETRHGSVFRRCLRADAEPAYPRYPVLPMLSCAGFDRVDEGS